MTGLPICDELRGSVNNPDWEPQFILRCRREIAKDVRLAREINALCACVTAIVDERESFVAELDMLAPKFVPVKMAKFMKHIQSKDILNLMKLCEQRWPMIFSPAFVINVNSAFSFPSVAVALKL
ncbi:hypothetical protein Tco_0128011 [Tanacetum coccineum]